MTFKTAPLAQPAGKPPKKKINVRIVKIETLDENGNSLEPPVFKFGLQDLDTQEIIFIRDTLQEIFDYLAQKNLTLAF
jgi:hypothetical protein